MAPRIAIEGISPELLEIYGAYGLQRAESGCEAVHWAFASNPAPFAVARQNGEIHGLSGYIRSSMIFDGARGVGLQAVDSYVSSAMRGKGIFTRLARAYDEHAQTGLGADLVWGFPNQNAAPAWFGKLGWRNHGQVPLLIKPLRAGFFLRRLGLPGDFSLSAARDQRIAPTRALGPWAEDMWGRCARDIGCGVIRDRDYLTYRLIEAPHAQAYRLVADASPRSGALVATREASKHGGRIAYLMEAMGGESLRELLMSEMGRLRARGVEMVLAWSFPWSPGHKTLRRAGFLPLPERLRPIRIWFGGRPKSARAACANQKKGWYLSYLDSDTI